MRDFQLQAPQSDQSCANRRLKSVPDLNKNLRKTAKKSSTPLFKADSEDDSAFLGPLKEFFEASDGNPLTENFLASDHPAETQPSESIVVSDLTSTISSSSSVIAAPYKQFAFDTKEPDVDYLKNTGSDEANVVINHLIEGRVQVLRSKNLLEALINIIIQEFHSGLHEEDEWLDKLLSRRSNLVFLIYVMVVFSLLIVLFLDWSSAESFSGPTPT